MRASVIAFCMVHTVELGERGGRNDWYDICSQVSFPVMSRVQVMQRGIHLRE